MRVLMKVGIPVEAGNKGVKEGTLPKVVGEFVEKFHPEAAFFTADRGLRTAHFVFDLKDATMIPSAAEPFFMAFNAQIECVPAMNLADLKTGVEKYVKGG